MWCFVPNREVADPLTGEAFCSGGSSRRNFLLFAGAKNASRAPRFPMSDKWRFMRRVQRMNTSFAKRVIGPTSLVVFSRLSAWLLNLSCTLVLPPVGRLNRAFCQIKLTVTMPKAPKSKKGSARYSPTSKAPAGDKKDPKQRHLYTDDNPATTLHGTGFKDAAAAEHTLDLVSKRSLTYQFQTINTMCQRAKGHPHPTEDMKQAIEIFQRWLKDTYPAAKEAKRDFKPALSKPTVQRYMERLEEDEDIDTAFAKAYVALEPRKRLANTLMNPEKPAEADLDRVRADQLSKLVPEGKQEEGFNDEELWEANKQISRYHLRLIALAWSPVSERKLP